ncbi:MAG: glycosyltransferase family 2 protein [Bryobacteraceae bacterium]|nr:glycosyltransferase family 2 protein [Bryobacteraceae bacterium]
MSNARVTVVIPTLNAGAVLEACLQSLDSQTMRDFEVVVVDNSGQALARAAAARSPRASTIENQRNLGFGEAVNQGIRRSRAPLIATLNDDAEAHPGWLAALVNAMESDPAVGMCASQVRLAGQDRLDSAGMLICADGSSKQRGHGAKPGAYSRPEDVLFPSASAALYRRRMLDEIGLFDESYFLYCEDTDLGLRARWAGWRCLYVPDAVVEHRYSHSAGRASALKAYFVERNRVFTVLKNFPLRMLLAVPFAAIARYCWHVVAMLQGRGKSAQFLEAGQGPLALPWYVVRSHWEALRHGPSLWRKRRAVPRKIGANQFSALARRHAISPREVAEL